MQYLKILDDNALNDIFNVAKWTGHNYKHALRQKLVLWKDSALYRQPVTGCKAEADNESCNATTSKAISATRHTLTTFWPIMKKASSSKITSTATNHWTMNTENSSAMSL